MKRLCAAIAGSVLLTHAASFAITLDAVLSQTLERNPAIQQARADVEQAAGRRLVLRSIAWPDLRADVFGGDQGGHRAGQPSNEPFGFARAFFTQPLFKAAVPPSFRRGDIELLLAEQRLNVAIVEQVHAARIAFYTALFNGAVGELAIAQRAQLSANVAGETDRYRAGQTGRGALASARALEQELGPRIEDSRRARDGALLTLAQVTASDVGPGARLPSPEGKLVMRPARFDVDREAAQASERRSDLQLARLLVRAAEEDQRIIEASYFPQINVVVSGNYIPVSDVRRDSGGSPQRANDVISSEVRAGGAFTWRVVDNGKVAGAAMRQRAIREMNELVLKRLEQNVPRELARIQHTLAGIDARHAALASAAGAAAQTATGVQQNLAQGLASQLEFRTAEATSLQTQTALLTVAYEQNVALAEWDRATGRYFQFSDDTHPKAH